MFSSEKSPADEKNSAERRHRAKRDPDRYLAGQRWEDADRARERGAPAPAQRRRWFG
ncbi:hypothetical protein G3I76_22930 [Streptomyces sp. SID11233]|uniref:hypothetical protein n=1 Tax=Streptomyces sp. SID11385 TaxID=2706031 RepID=UPI0013BF7289|nr:hypothetical protein [Streptomyces sp. SID11385]NEA42720.1 hypothetical protein [Streptomyces sp. SID11385]NED82943.1 hypothetical protein [Streptomyces sp. SID11233]